MGKAKNLYEKGNHLGNVLVTVSDKKLAVSSNNTTIDYYNADVVTANDYYPFGFQMPGRKYSQPNSSYRYGFNGKEKDNNTGVGNLDFGARIMDVRLGRWLSVDPLQKKYSEFTPYNFCINSPLIYKDYDGRDIIIVTKNGTFNIAKETLLKTPSGKAIWEKYSKSKKEDVYLLVVANAGSFTGGATTHFNVGETKLLKREIVSKGEKKIVTDNEFHIDSKDEKFSYLSALNGVDVTKSKGRKIHVIAFSERFFTDDKEKRKSLAAGYNEYGNGDLTIEPILTLADIIMHEFKAHIEMNVGGRSNAKSEHERYGQTQMGPFRTDTYKTKEDSPAAEFHKELKKVYDDMKREESKANETPADEKSPEEKK